MAGSNNFLQFNPTAANQETDAAYSADSMRTGGAAASAIFPSNVANKLFFQISTFVAAFAAMMAAKNYNMLDSNLANLQTALANIVTQFDFTLTANTLKLPNGFMLQWGTTGTLNNNTPTTVSFNSVFPTGCYGVIATDNGPNATGGNPRTMGTTVSSTSQFTVLASGSGATAFWIAVGH